MLRSRVLSVDVDFLFTDMLKYQKYIDTELTAAQSWQVIAWRTGTSDYRPCMNSNYFLESVIKAKCLKAEVAVITEHDEIIRVLEEKGISEADMWNMDYHHDLSYGGEDEDLNIENWVQIGRKRNLIGQYWWVTQDDAKLCHHTPIKHQAISWKDVDVDKMPDFDLVVFCTSRHFTPKKFWGLAGRLAKMTKEIQEVSKKWDLEEDSEEL